MQIQTRTSFMVSQKEFQLLTRLIKKAGLRRDAFIGRLLSEELRELRKLKRNTDEESKIVSRSLKARHPVQTKINIMLPKELVEELNALCREKNIKRTCFFNRFIEFINVRCALSLAVLAQPRKTLKVDELQLLDALAEHSNAISEYREWLHDRSNEGEAHFSILDQVLYLEDFYSRELSVTEDDPRLLGEQERLDLLEKFLASDLGIE